MTIILVLIVLACLILLITGRSGVSGDTKPRYDKSTLTGSAKAAHAASVRQLMESGQIYRRSGLRLGDVAEELGVPEYVLSQVINETFEASFTDLLSTYRVEAAKTLLRSSDYSDYTIEGIGQEVGFRSRTSVYTVFKRLVGLTPAQYRDEAGE